MVNKKIWLGMLVMALVFGLTVISCDDGSTSGETVPRWAQGTWYFESSGVYRTKLANITSYQLILYNGTESIRLNYLGSNKDTVFFESSLMVKRRGSSSIQLCLGLEEDYQFILYK